MPMTALYLQILTAPGLPRPRPEALVDLQQQRRARCARPAKMLAASLIEIRQGQAPLGNGTSNLEPASLQCAVDARFFCRKPP